MDLIAPIRTFVRVVETGSFSAVAAEQNSSQPTISRQVAVLEQHLGARLLTRTTRTVALTDEGRAFYDRALLVLRALSEAEGVVGRRRVKPSVVLRLAVPVVFGRLHIMPLMSRFLTLYPDVTIDLVLNDGFTDLVEEGIDLAIRVGDITDPQLIARRIGLTRRVTVASPAYLAARGVPERPEDLTKHDCVVYSRLATGRVWRFAGPAGPIDVTVTGRLITNNSEAVREGVVMGLGIGVLPVWHFSGELENGSPVVILKDFEPPALPMHAVYPSRQFVPLKTRVATDFLAGEFRLDPRLSDHVV